LIAQIYHIDAHYPNGVLFWALGGLVTAYLLQSQPAMIAAVALGILWTGMESLGFDQVHGGFLLFWIAFLPAVYQWRWMSTLHMAMIALLTWSTFTYFSIDIPWGEGGHLYLIQIYFILYLSLFIVGMLMLTSTRLSDYARIIQNYSVIATLYSFYILTFPRLQSGLSWGSDLDFRSRADDSWIIATIITLVILVALATWHRLRTSGGQRPGYLVYAQLLIGATVILILTNLFVTGVHGSWMAVAFNFLFFGGVVWLTFAGMHTNNRFLINIAFIFFAMGLLSRYFDTFWTLLNRSFFFMAGGLILIVGGHLLEQQRRRITARVMQSQTQDKQT